MSRVIASKRKEGVKQHFESPFHDLECRAPQLMQLELSRGSTQPRTSDSRAFLVSLGHLDVVSLDKLELEQGVNALDRQTALLHAFLPLARRSRDSLIVLAANLNLRVCSLRYLFGILFSSASAR